MSKTFRKSQAAMEFLMTYGWAILVFLIVIGTLSYFGVLSPDKFLPSKCLLPAGIACSDFNVASNAVQIVLTNSLGQDITITDINIKDCQGDPLGPSLLRNGQKATFTVGMCTLSEEKYSSELNVTYTGESGLEHTVTGTITARNAFEIFGGGDGSRR